ncbi:membrane protease FtsH catalytic subunit [Marinobacter sp. DSM 26671]|jgi:cell division protease FtsH|nr:membrane protein containing peptidase M41, FtsH / ATPase, AAA-type, core [Marinobacter adhaerens HP15]AKV98642.1 ATP-dependent metalloprotease [Marinobacter sp. CP1]MBI47288.1 ATP-dependent zinc metalloprotease FtsH [Marinobacter sp.]MCK5866120.1 ATP-dependent zinc metalloprotease FtsH [Marinobacter adhaerens]MCP4062478.1 ATP-dependent zinc metalloprotease FtsH [Gammaproteobacteria bacterium]PPI80724.1 ATP-dependent zinc metalloprotease FtsH [Marinobacter flavimaris]ROQ47760.1 membrane pro|tara:strand:- start:1914 stop:3848 length:1935 start_codon:yes stop_codon:yes gene_type:complete
MAKNLVLWLIIAAVLLMVFQNFSPTTTGQQVNYSQFVEMVQEGQVRQVTIDGLQVQGTRGDGSQFQTIRPQVSDNKLMDDLLANNVEVIGKEPERQSLWTQLLVAAFPILIIIALFVFFMRQMQGGGGGKGPMSFGKSKARLMSEDQIKTTFADVAGVDEAKEDVKELVDFLRDPSKFQRLGGSIPKGVLMVGQPGTGKTLLAKAIAGEAKVPFFSISGSDFVEMFVGVGASRVRDMFEQAKKQSPCIIFIDEIDAVGRHRGAGMGGGHDEREQTLNQLLVEMDGFEGNEGVIVIAATNRPDVLDPALLRPGRFDRQVVVGLPDIIGREQILKVHMKKVPLADGVEPVLIARGTPGFSGADLANLVNEAALFAARRNQRLVSMEEFELAKDKIMMGAERKSMVMSEKEKRNTAYHESGHAIVGRLMPEHDPVYKVSIIPRGRALGVTMFLPEEDKYSHSKRFLISSICSLFGGRIAEELTLGFDGVTTGASNDIERATSLARNMVTRWGLSEKLGPLQYDTDSEEPFLGRSAGQSQTVYSPETAQRIDEEVRNIIDSCYEKAKQILVDNRDKLDMMADALMKYETIDRHQIDDIMEGRTPRPPKGWGDSGPAGGVKADEPETAPEPKASDDGRHPGVGRPAGEH